MRHLYGILAVILLITNSTVIIAQIHPNDRREQESIKITRTGEDGDTIFSLVEEFPSFPGGESKMMNFLSSNIIYPAAYAELNITGTVVLSFVVDKEGNLSDFNVLKGVKGAPLFAEESLRVLRLSPKWLPGKIAGRPVKVQFNLPIKFSLKDLDKPVKERK